MEAADRSIAAAELDDIERRERARYNLRPLHSLSSPAASATSHRPKPVPGEAA